MSRVISYICTYEVRSLDGLQYTQKGRQFELRAVFGTDGTVPQLLV